MCNSFRPESSTGTTFARTLKPHCRPSAGNLNLDFGWVYVEWAALDSNQRLPPCESASPTSEPLAESELTPTPSDACTSACTSEGEKAHDSPQDAGQGQLAEDGSDAQPDPLAAIAAAIGALSPADRARLAAMLTGK
jgi:hypothetical protein